MVKTILQSSEIRFLNSKIFSAKLTDIASRECAAALHVANACVLLVLVKAMKAVEAVSEDLQ